VLLQSLSQVLRLAHIEKLLCSKEQIQTLGKRKLIWDNIPHRDVDHSHRRGNSSQDLRLKVFRLAQVQCCPTILKRAVSGRNALSYQVKFSGFIRIADDGIKADSVTTLKKTRRNFSGKPVVILLGKMGALRTRPTGKPSRLPKVQERPVQIAGRIL
jgi:hypothetical protein